VPQLQQMPPAGLQLAGQLGGGRALGEAAEDQEDPRRGAMGPLPGGAGEQVEDPAAVAAAVVDHRGAVAAAVDGVPIGPASTAGASQALGVEQVQELLIAGHFVHQVEDREVHGAASGG
jgi:hypothetical protein